MRTPWSRGCNALLANALRSPESHDLADLPASIRADRQPHRITASAPSAAVMLVVNQCRTAVGAKRDRRELQPLPLFRKLPVEFCPTCLQIASEYLAPLRARDHTRGLGQGECACRPHCPTDFL